MQKCQKMKSKRAYQYKVQHPMMNDASFRQLVKGVMAYRQNLIERGTPYPPEEPNSEKVAQHKKELDKRIQESQAEIKKLEDMKERYNQLLRTIYEEESRMKDEQKKRTNARPETPSSYLQGH